MVRHLLLLCVLLAGIGAVGETISITSTGLISSGSTKIDHGKLISTQLACIKNYEDGFIDYVPCDLSTPMLEPINFVKPAAADNKWGTEGNGGGDLPTHFLNQPIQVDALDDVQTADDLPYDSVDCDNANGDPKLCTVEPDEPSSFETYGTISVNTTIASYWTLNPSNMVPSDYPPVPPEGLIECWRDKIFDHLMCINSKGTVIDVERDLELNEPQRWGGGEPIILQGVDEPSHKVLSWTSPEHAEYNGDIVSDNTHLFQEFNQDAQKAADETNCKLADEEPHMPHLYQPKPIDVPAIQEVRNELMENCFPVRDGLGCYRPVYKKVCKDKSRILLPPDGNGKSWCHLVQP